MNIIRLQKVNKPYKTEINCNYAGKKVRLISRANNFEHINLDISIVISLLFNLFEIRLLHRKEQFKIHMLLHNGLRF